MDEPKKPGKRARSERSLPALRPTGKPPASSPDGTGPSGNCHGSRRGDFLPEIPTSAGAPSHPSLTTSLPSSSRTPEPLLTPSWSPCLLNLGREIGLLKRDHTPAVGVAEKRVLGMIGIDAQRVIPLLDEIRQRLLDQTSPKASHFAHCPGAARTCSFVILNAASAFFLGETQNSLTPRATSAGAALHPASSVRPSRRSS
jgi:hypothetical protein